MGVGTTALLAEQLKTGALRLSIEVEFSRLQEDLSQYLESLR